MYARTTTIQGSPDKVDAGIAHVRDVVLPAVTAMDGCIGMSLLVDREAGRAIATTAWESEAAMANSAQKVLSLRDGAQEVLGASTSEVDAWELAVAHRDHASPQGACARVTYLSGFETPERVTDYYRMTVLPQLQEMTGFCSATLMINRETRRAVGTLVFENRQQLEATREDARRIREGSASGMGAMIDDVAEMELAVAHLHVPEMA